MLWKQESRVRRQDKRVKKREERGKKKNISGTSLRYLSGIQELTFPKF